MDAPVTPFTRLSAPAARMLAVETLLPTPRPWATTSWRAACTCSGNGFGNRAGKPNAVTGRSRGPVDKLSPDLSTDLSARPYVQTRARRDRDKSRGQLPTVSPHVQSKP